MRKFLRVLHIFTAYLLKIVEDTQVFHELRLDLVDTVQDPLIHLANVVTSVVARLFLFFFFLILFRDLNPRAVNGRSPLPFLLSCGG